MKMKMLLTALLISTALTACSNTVEKPTTPQKTSRDIMKGLYGKSSAPESFRKGPVAVAYRAPTVNDYTRSEAKELRGLFPRLPNPDVCMYIEPHLSSENATIPGYTSCFSMYEKNHYALPGEMMATWQKR